jgi:hypothetical protein
VRSIDASKKHAVTLTFLLDEKITPQLFAQKIVLACGGDALLPGEAILVEHAKIACVVTDETLSVPHFSYQWRKSPKAPKHSKPARKGVGK